MLKRFTSLLLLAALIGSNCSRFFVFAGFELNHKFIADNFCINKNRPWLHCNGKCYFMKKIQQAEENEKKQETKKNLTRLEVSIFQEPQPVSFIEPVILDTTLSTFPLYAHHYCSSYLSTIFRPPKQVA